MSETDEAACKHCVPGRTCPACIAKRLKAQPMDEAVGRLVEVSERWAVLSDERGRASGDIATVLARLDAAERSHKLAWDTLATLRERLDKMAMRFRDYGEHTEACDSWSGVSTDPSGCSCGFTAAWYAAFPEDKPAVAVIRGEEKNESP